MKQFLRRSGSLIAALALMLSVTAPMACAAENASYYFASTSAVAYAQDDGKILIEADVCATDIMDEVGFKSITIYEQQSNGLYDDVAVYTRYDTAGMIRTNDFELFKSLTYQGTVGTKYFATVAFYAKDSSGSEAIYSDSNIVTAVAVAP